MRARRAEKKPRGFHRRLGATAAASLVFALFALVAPPSGCGGRPGERVRPAFPGARARTPARSAAGPGDAEQSNASFGMSTSVGGRERLRVHSVSARAEGHSTSIRIDFSSPVVAEEAGERISVQPPVAFSAEAVRNTVVLHGAFQPGGAYQITVGAGLAGEDGSLLTEAYTAPVSVPDLPPSVKFRSSGMFLRTGGPRALEIETLNAAQVKLSVARVYPSNLFFLASYYHRVLSRRHSSTDWSLPRKLGDTVLHKTFDVALRRNQPVTTLLGADELTRGKPGIYRIGVSLPNKDDTEYRWLLLTDIGIVAKKAQQGLLVWASSFADLSAVAGARVEVLSNQNQLLASGRTDAGGLLLLPDLTAESEGSGKPFLITVEHDGDRSFLLFDDTEIGTAGLDVGGTAGPGGAYDAYLYGERDLYRPGETVHGVALIRETGLTVPPPMPLLLRHKDPRGRVRRTLRVEADDTGVASFEYDLAPSERTGHHSLELIAGERVIGVYRFQVEEFEPDRIAVRVRPAGAAVRRGETIDYETGADYLFGAPGADLPVETHVRLRARRFAPAGYESYSFEDPDRRFAVQEIFSDEARLDTGGLARFSVPVPADLAPPSALEAVLTSHVSEAGGRGVSARAVVAVDPYPYYLGLRRDGDDSPEPGRELTFRYVAVTPAGQPAEAARLRVEFHRQHWHTVLRRTAAHGYRYESERSLELIDAKTLAAGTSGGQFAFTPRTYGGYRVVVRDPATGAAAALSFYADGWGYSPWAIDNPARIELQLDRGEYAAGDTAIVDVRAPFPGKLLLSVEREDVRYTAVRRITGNSARLEIPVRPGYRPNVYVTAVLVRGARDLGPGEVARAFGAAVLNVDRSSHRLPVRIEAAAETRPGRPLRVTVTAEPGAALTVAAVDEGILQLVAQKTADPFAYFYRRRPLRVRSFDIFSRLFPDAAPIEGAAPTGGGRGEEGVYLRTQPLRRSTPVAFWSGPLRADSQGRAQATFDLPEFEGSLRVMAVAHRGDRFGAAEAEAKVRNPIVVLPTVPRVLSFDESFELPVTIRNGTGRAGLFDVTLDGDGPIRVAEARVPAVEIPAGAGHTVRFHVETGDAEGDARFAFRVAGNGEATVAHAAVTVRPDLPVRVDRRAGRLDTARTVIDSGALAALRPGTRHRRLRVGSQPLVPLAGHLAELLRYPYGCIEQTTSRAFPLVNFADLAKPLAPDLLRAGKAEAFVQAAVERLSTMQMYDGSFSMWPGGDVEYPWGSVYATHFLVEARDAGYRVEATVYDDALEHLAAVVRSAQTPQRRDLERRAYALYVLARAGRPDRASMQVLRDRHGGGLRPAFGALLGAAYALTGRPEVLDELTAGVDELRDYERDSGGSLNSATRNRALFLLALLDGNPADPRIPRFVADLLGDAQVAAPWSTQETAFTFLALGRFARLQREESACSGSVFAGERKIGAFTQDGGAFDIDGDLPLRIELDGSGKDCRPFFSLRTSGVPTDAAFVAEENGIRVERTLHDREGNLLDPKGIRQGDLIVVRTRVRSTAGRLHNVVIEQLLPSGLEVENPRLESSDALPWLEPGTAPENVDIRADRLLLFADLPDSAWQDFYSQFRAVTAGRFRFPPVRVEAMYDPERGATGARRWVEIGARQ